MRFTSFNSHILEASFEFYSDFIFNTTNANKWSYIGKYALTTETNLAYQRLEPHENCLENWLRYNDNAFVNVNNYQTKWNGSELAVLDKIETSVEKYIYLSDDVDNVRAIEIFPFDDQSAVTECALNNPDSDYDPYIPDATADPETAAASGIEISYLDVLNMGSLDYHVARMLGLGTLDLNTIVFDGEYVYLSEYITFGDLQDGLGAREVQHLYCSLPTSISDQRLCIPIDIKLLRPGVFVNNGYDGTEVDPGDDEGGDGGDDQGGVVTNEGIGAIELTDDGFSPDGKTRYYTIYTEDIFEEDFDASFYYVDHEFISADYTLPVFAGLEYKKADESNWVKPELSYDTDYFNNDTSGIDLELANETVSLLIPESGDSLFTHAVRESGISYYSSYGINWFSRAVSSAIIKEIETILKNVNQLLPPSDITSTLIQKENPLLLSSAYEQSMLESNPNSDKTLVRLTFEYNHAQELIDYHQKINGELITNYMELPDEKELFADQIQIFFRDQIPNVVYGKIGTLIDDASNPLLVEVQTAPYIYASSGETIEPNIPSGLDDNFVGSIMVVNEVGYVIHQVDNSGVYPKFTILKSDVSLALTGSETGSVSENELLSPETGNLFMIVENMQNIPSWGTPNPNAFNVNIDLTEVFREGEIMIYNTDCTTETHVQKFRGVYQSAIITKVYENVDENEDGSFDIIVDGDNDPTNDVYIQKHLGLYEIRFPGFQLAQHSQYNLNSNSVEWYNGVVRIHTLSPVGLTPRKTFKVIRTKNIGSSNDLVLFVQDPTFPTYNPLDPLELDTYKDKIMADEVDSIELMTNYYPGYKVYLYQDDATGLNSQAVLPLGDDDTRYTIFSLRSMDFANEFEYDNTIDFFSKLSPPTFIFAQAIIEPLPPQMPTGGMYATRPDFFGKATYTFNTKYGTLTDIHKPYSVQFNRASDIQFLSSIYDNSVKGYDVVHQPILNTVQHVMQTIFMNGEEAFYVDRWNDLLSFNYPSGTFASFEERTLPMPNSTFFISGINAFIDAHNQYYHLTGTAAVAYLDGPTEENPTPFNLNTVVIAATPQNDALLVKDFLKNVLLNCFVPLTEIPIIYNYVKGGDYKPIPKKQVIRDKDGNLLKATDLDFDIAPMMKRIDPQITGNQYESQFTDFGLDGASNAKYFYAAREINNQMKVSDYSAILGPISLVNAAPPVAPGIIKIIPVLENRASGVNPAIQIQINSYPVSQKIAKISIYRTDNANDALSIRTMKLVRVIDLEVENLLGESQWKFVDDFSDIPEVPYGDPLYYRITVARRIRYNDKDLVNVVDYVPSEASKLVITNIVENYSPESPIMSYTAYDYNPETDNTISDITLSWPKTTYKGNYHLYKLNSQGNWVEIIKIVADRVYNGQYHYYNLDTDGNWVNTIHPETINEPNGMIYVPLEKTNLATSYLETKSAENEPIYHHFKVLTENTAGMLSKRENILTIFDSNTYQNDGGISSVDNPDGMIVEGSFKIR